MSYTFFLQKQKQTKNMDRETRDLEKHLQRTPRKKDNQVISNYFLRNGILFQNCSDLL